MFASRRACSLLRLRKLVRTFEGKPKMGYCRTLRRRCIAREELASLKKSGTIMFTCKCILRACEEDVFEVQIVLYLHAEMSTKRALHI
jgi:hypothetical protein